MATVTASYNWVSGETVTPTKLNTTAAPTVAVADNEVTTAKILDANVTTAKIADANVTAAKLASSAVETAKLASGAVTTAKIAASTIVGYVAQSGGLPTGSLFETGNNGIYGTWLKLADGTMFCWVVQVSGTWFFPVPFISAPQVVFGTAGSSSAGPVCMFSNVLNDRATVYVQNTNPVAAAPSTGAAWLAIGRWF